ncbi:MAG: hypothetical protein JW798_18660 [Prolixibacteraceae bacterium]|nr:hypothetical protein [Prolixibacteraceae bacterium]
MAKIEDQRIVVWCNSNINLLNTILDAVYIALRFEKEVCLFANFKTSKQEKFLKEKLATLSATIKRDIPQVSVSTLMLKGPLFKHTGSLGGKYNVILFCTGLKISNNLLKAFYRSGFPFYFSAEKKTGENHFKKIIVPIDYRNSTKDAILWGSYFGRFNNSEIEMIYAEDNDPDLKSKVENIIAFVKKFYSQFYFNYWIENGNASSWKIHKKALNISADFDLLIFSGSFNVTFLDYIIGPFEKRIINKENHVPMLLVNPQKEMYVLCK